MNIPQAGLIIIGSVLIIPGIIFVIEFGLHWRAFLIASVPFFVVGGSLIILGFTKLIKNWELPIEKLAKEEEGMIEKLPPLQRQYVINTLIMTCSVSLFSLATISIAYMFRNHPTPFEESLTSFFNEPITLVLLLTSVVAVTAGVLLWRIKRLGAILAIAALGLTITSLILIVTFSSNLFIPFSGIKPVLFSIYVIFSAYPVVFVIKYWKDLKPLIHKIE